MRRRTYEWETSIMKAFALLMIAIAAFGAVAAGSVDARSLRDIGGAIVYPGKKVVKNAGHNAKHVTGDPNRRRHGRPHKRHHSR